MDALKEDVEKVLQGLKANKLSQQGTNQDNNLARPEAPDSKQKPDNDNFNNVLTYYITTYSIKPSEIKILRKCLETKNNLFMSSVDAYIKIKDENALKKSMEILLNKQKKDIFGKAVKTVMKTNKLSEYEHELVKRSFDEKNILIISLLERYVDSESDEELVKGFMKVLNILKEQNNIHEGREGSNKNNSKRYIDILMKVFGQNNNFTQDDFNKLNLKIEENNAFLLNSLDKFDISHNNLEVVDAIKSVLSC